MSSLAKAEIERLSNAVSDSGSAIDLGRTRRRPEAIETARTGTRSLEDAEALEDNDEDKEEEAAREVLELRGLEIDLTGERIQSSETPSGKMNSASVIIRASTLERSSLLNTPSSDVVGWKTHGCHVCASSSESTSASDATKEPMREGEASKSAEMIRRASESEMA